jgi:hypothetical protein
LGTGALNVGRALKQYKPGEFDPGQIPLLGWDDNVLSPNNPDAEYFFNGSLRANSYVSITLCWDRLVQLSGDDAFFNAGETFTARPLADLDLFLLKKNPGNGMYEQVDSSISAVDNTEHIFTKLAAAGEYAIRVVHRGNVADGARYGLAWWAVPEPTGLSGLITVFLGLCVRRPPRSFFGSAAKRCNPV